MVRTFMVSFSPLVRFGCATDRGIAALMPPPPLTRLPANPRPCARARASCTNAADRCPAGFDELYQARWYNLFSSVPLPRTWDGVVLYPPDERLPRHPEHLRRLRLVPPALLQRLHDEEPLRVELRGNRDLRGHFLGG